jgi:hypothetical protein
MESYASKARPTRLRYFISCLYPLLKSAVQVSPWMENGDAITYLQGHPNADRAQMLYDIASGLGEVLAILS